jgi:putative ABC transport system permease protein
MHLLWQDLRYGARLLWKAPAFSVAALVALALGMGAATAIFSVVDAVLLKPLPFRDPGRLLQIWEKNPAQNRYKLFVAPVNFLAWQKQSRTIEQMAALQDIKINLTGGPNGHIEPEEIQAERATASLFPMLGVQAAVGHVFRPEEDQPGNANFVLLSHSFWQRRCGADPAITGKAIRLREQPYVVTGVLPPGFETVQPGIDVWIPMGLNPSDARGLNYQFLTVIARRSQPIETVRAELDTIGAQMEAAVPQLNRGRRPSVFELSEERVGGVRRALWVLLGAVACLLLIACVNVANLLLARGATRRREIALRAAVGAGRGRIVTQLLSESLLLSLAGGALGFGLAAGGIRVMVGVEGASVPRLAEASVDVHLFLFALAISLVTGILFGVAPALSSTGAALSTTLNQVTRGGTLGRRGRAVRDGLVIAEVAMAVVVLIGAGLLIRSFIRLRNVDPGFRPAGLLTMRVPLSGGRYARVERREPFFEELSARVAALPGVVGVGAINGLPLTGLGLGTTFAVAGRPAPPVEQRPMSLYRSVTPGYFRTMAIPLSAGRWFAASDSDLSAPVAIVNQTLARRFWPGENPIGGRLMTDTDPPRTVEIIGVVGDVKPDRVENEDWPEIYVPYAQAPYITMVLAVRTSTPPHSVAAAVQREVRALDPDQPLSEVRPMTEVVDESVSGQRFNTGLLSTFAFIAFVLAAVGIYGVVSYDVSERAGEIGIRMALGAQPGDVLRMVVGHGAKMAAWGIGLGLLAAFGLTRLMSTMLFGVDPTDAWTFGAIAILLAAVALFASYLPSRRATALNPVAALRHE